MSEYEVGFGKPPRETRFKPGKSGNPRGRPKKTASQLEKLVRRVLDAPMQYRENGRTKTATRSEVAIKLQVQRAIKGSIAAAELLLAMRKHAMQHGNNGVTRLVVNDWLPEFAGQATTTHSRADKDAHSGSRTHTNDAIGTLTTD